MRKTNQDNYIIEKEVAGIPGCQLYAVMDGHGGNGHLVSGFIKRTMMMVLEELLFHHLNKGQKLSINHGRHYKAPSAAKSFLPPL